MESILHTQHFSRRLQLAPVCVQFVKNTKQKIEVNKHTLVSSQLKDVMETRVSTIKEN